MPQVRARRRDIAVEVRVEEKLGEVTVEDYGLGIEVPLECFPQNQTSLVNHKEIEKTINVEDVENVDEIGTVGGIQTNTTNVPRINPVLA